MYLEKQKQRGDERVNERNRHARLKNKIKIAIARVRQFEPPEGYYVAFSGGKDSQVVEKICEIARVKYELWHHHTTLDQPELVRFIREKYPQCNVMQPKLSIWKLMVRELFPPTRRIRYCCEELKEGGGKGRIVITGVRWDESVRREKLRGVIEIERRHAERRTIFRNCDSGKARRLLEQCTRYRKHILNPIIDWSTEEVWRFVREQGIEYCPLYDQGYTRIGCIGCPMKTTKQRLLDFEKYPTYKKAFLAAFDQIIEVRNSKGKKLEKFSSGQELFDWWIESYKTREWYAARYHNPLPGIVNPATVVSNNL